MELLLEWHRLEILQNAIAVFRSIDIQCTVPLPTPVNSSTLNYPSTEDHLLSILLHYKGSLIKVGTPLKCLMVMEK